MASFFADVKKGAFKRAMQTLSEQPTNRIEAALLKGGRLVAEDAKQNVGQSKIQKNITYVLLGAGTKEPVVEVGVPKKLFWSWRLEFGTSGHEEEPETKSVLSWVPKDKRLGAFMFYNAKKKREVKRFAYLTKNGTTTLEKKEAYRITVKSVDHPGHQAKPFLYPAYNTNRAKVKEMLTDAILSVIKNAGRVGSD